VGEAALHKAGGPIRRKERPDGLLRRELRQSCPQLGLIAPGEGQDALVVADSAHEPSYVPALEAARYVLRIREPDWHEHRMFKGPDVNINLHVYTAGSPEIDRYLLFRDRLRTQSADREQYAETKRVLAQQTWRYVQNYADAKSAVVEEIIARARAAQE
jgi:GrpB-like predicted nucleotidyltransferase (UPF0157 family)